MQRHSHEEPQVLGVEVRLCGVRETVCASKGVTRMLHVSSWEHTMWLLRYIGDRGALVEGAIRYISLQFRGCSDDFRFTHQFSN